MRGDLSDIPVENLVDMTVDAVVRAGRMRSERSA